MNALVAWRRILSYKLCIDLLHKEETLECYVVTMVLILWEHRKNWKRHTVKWIIRRFNSSFRTLVQIPPASSHMGVFGKTNLVGKYNTDVFIAQTWRISKQ